MANEGWYNESSVHSVLYDIFDDASDGLDATAVGFGPLIADISLGTFLAMSLMSMQLWTLIDLAGPIITILAAQFLVAVLVNIFIIFPVMGRNYDAAVVSAGFGGISLGSTPTAMANMAAVSQHYGASHLAFIVVPLVAAFFIDLVNAVQIPFFLHNF